MIFRIHIDREKCNGCEECVDVCSAQVLKMQHWRAFAKNAEACVGCESCVEVCKQGAITIEDTRVEISETLRALLRDIL